ncbi:MAG TPA: nuclear transport factor 2 family protein [Sphingomicrobium sp.]|nr:nuclear transport factor 2 family protein [Sphingomicrobium sp.]
MSDDRIALIERLYASFAAADMGSVADLLAETEWHEAQGMPYGGRYNGANEVFENVFLKIGQDVEGFSARPDELLPVGENRVLALGRYRGKGKSGEVDAVFAHVWTVEDGKIVKFVQYADTHQYRAAIGA